MFSFLFLGGGGAEGGEGTATLRVPCMSTTLAIKNRAVMTTSLIRFEGITSARSASLECSPNFSVSSITRWTQSQSMNIFF